MIRLFNLLIRLTNIETLKKLIFLNHKQNINQNKWLIFINQNKALIFINQNKWLIFVRQSKWLIFVSQNKGLIFLSHNERNEINKKIYNNLFITFLHYIFILNKLLKS